jgi:recombinational DNA repair ATPase RecF
MVYIVMYDGLDGWEVESVYNSLELARIRLEFIRSLKLRVSPYIQEIEIGDKTLTLEIAKEIQEKNTRKTIKSLKADVVW